MPVCLSSATFPKLSLTFGKKYFKKAESPLQTLPGEEGLQTFLEFLIHFSTVLKNAKVPVKGYVLCVWTTANLS